MLTLSLIAVTMPTVFEPDRYCIVAVSVFRLEAENQQPTSQTIGSLGSADL